MSNRSKIWTEDEVAAYFMVSPETISRERKRGRLKFIRIGDRIRFTDAHIETYIKDRECAPEDAGSNITELPRG